MRSLAELDERLSRPSPALDADLEALDGDIMVLGALSYAAPLFSVIVLLAAGYGACHWSVAAACALIVAGALIAAKDMLSRRPDATDGLRPEVA